MDKIISLSDFIGNLKDSDGNEGDHYDLICYGSGKDFTFRDLPVECIEQKGGGEGGSEYCYSILKIGESLYMIEYSYYSHHGYDYDDSNLYLVEPKQKMVTVYEKV